MALDLEKLKIAMDKYLDSDEYKHKLELEKMRSDKLANFKTKLDSGEIIFKDIFLKSLSKHDSNYEDYCYAHGYEPKPNNTLEFLLDIMEEYGTHLEKVEDITITEFSNTVVYYDGFYHQVICGQGCFSRIYDENKKLLLQL